MLHLPNNNSQHNFQNSTKHTVGTHVFWFYGSCSHYYFSFYASSSPEATSSSSDPRENTEHPTILQQPRPDVTSTSHFNTKANTSHESNSSPHGCDHDKKCSVKSSVKSPSREYSRPKSVVQSNLNPQCYKERLSPHQHSEENKMGRTFPENDPGPFSSRSNVKSKVSWV